MCGRKAQEQDGCLFDSVSCKAKRGKDGEKEEVVCFSSATAPEKHHCGRGEEREKHNMASHLRLVDSPPLQSVSYTCFITGKSGFQESAQCSMQISNTFLLSQVSLISLTWLRPTQVSK